MREHLLREGMRLTDAECNSVIEGLAPGSERYKLKQQRDGENRWPTTKEYTLENLDDAKIQVIGQDQYDIWWPEGKNPPIEQERRMAQKASVQDVRSPRTLAKDTAPRTFQREKEKVPEARPTETKDVRVKDGTLERKWPGLKDPRTFDMDPHLMADAALRAAGQYWPPSQGATSAGSARGRSSHSDYARARPPWPHRRRRRHCRFRMPDLMARNRGGLRCEENQYLTPLLLPLLLRPPKERGQSNGRIRVMRHRVLLIGSQEPHLCCSLATRCR